jgi:hypothetical protein
VRQHREAIQRTGLKPQPTVQVAVPRLEPPDAQVEGALSTENSPESRVRRDVNKLKRHLAEKMVDFFRRALQTVEARRKQSDTSGERCLRRNSKNTSSRCEISQRS